MSELLIYRNPDRGARWAAASPTNALSVAVTGGIGAGKSTAVQTLKTLGAKTCSADELAGQALVDLAPDIARAFDHPEWETGVDRSALAAIVFNNPDARRLLESITHPYIAFLSDRFFASLTPGNIGIYDIPLLAENPNARAFDVIVAVTAPLQQRYQRLQERSGMEPAQVDARIAAQATEEQRRAIANFELVNDTTREDLRRTIASELWPELRRLANGDSA